MTHQTDTGRERATRGVVREAVGIFDSAEALQRAVDELSLAGFDRSELSLMANNQTIEGTLGRVPRSVDEAKHDPDAPRQSFVAPEDEGDARGVAIGVPAYVGAIIATGAVVATGGTALAAALAAAAAGVGGGAVGSVLSQWLTDKRNEPLRQHLDKGGILLWVNLRDATQEAQARTILGRHGARPVEVHEVPQSGAD
ncbi:hypothetical protein [Azospirillum sp. ST 5-10]|uniref:hypothetical protein n=1 Tax=unclassified Azospirillum TaxID=2630922 RepID=UPI003F4A686B